MGRSNEGFRSGQIADSQRLSNDIRLVGAKEAGYTKGIPARYTSEEGFQEAIPKSKGIKPKRIRQALGKE